MSSSHSRDGSPSPRAQGRPLLAARWVRVATGLALAGMSILLAGAAWRMPFLVIRAGGVIHTIGGAAQTENLHLVLVATGALGACLALCFALGSAPLRATFFVVGGVATGFSTLMLATAWQHVQRSTVPDPLIYAQIKGSDAVMQIGFGLWACLLSGLAILGLGVLATLVARAEQGLQRTSSAGRATQR